MSKLHDLIKTMCPHGVEFVKLNTLGAFENIGVDKKTVPGEPLVRLLNYVDVYKNKYINKNIPQMTVSSPQKKLDSCSIKQWDIFVTPTSETRDDIGHSAVAIEDIDGAVYSYHIMRFRLNNPNRVTACFINYLFESQEVQKQIFKFASGQTRFGLSKYKFGDIVIPFPPIEVQEEIVKILDRFADYAAELQAELQARKEQYEYYRNLLLTFNPSACGCGTDGEQKMDDVTTWGGHSYKITWKAMGEIGTFIRGKRFVRTDIVDNGVPCIHYGDMYTHYGLYADKTPGFINDDVAKKMRYANKNDVVIVAAGENKDDLGNALAWLGDEPAAVHDACFIFKSEMYPNFVSHVCRSLKYHKQVRMYANEAKICSVSGTDLAKVIIPVPEYELQVKIASILDRFETLVNDLTTGLPAEIAAVKEQYEYYRNKLLTFKQIA